MAMTVKDSAALLKKYNSWRRGKGKKYMAPGFPADFDCKKIGEAIDVAVSAMSLDIDYADLDVVVRLAGAFNAYARKMKADDVKAVCKERNISVKEYKAEQEKCLAAYKRIYRVCRIAKRRIDRAESKKNG